MRVLAKLFLFSSTILSSGLVFAADNSGLTVVPAIDFGFKQSSMNISVNGGPYTSAYQPSYITLIPSIAIAYGSFYGAISYDTPLTEYHSSTGGTSNAPAYSDNTYSRQESTMTLGYRLFPSLSIFGGYIKGQTKIRSIDYQNISIPPNNILQPYPGDLEFNTQGYFGGMSVSHSYSDKGTIALSAAYATLDGTIDSNYSNVSGTIKSQNASGYSTSLSWTGPLVESVYYRIGYRYAQYYYQFQSQASMKVQEPVQGLTIGISKYF